MEIFLKMRNEIITTFFVTIANFLENLGIVWKFLINGLIGATIWAIYKKEKFLTAIRQIVIGGVISGYFTPVVVTKTDLSLSYVGFTSFVIGMLGMVIIDSLYKYVIKNYFKWKEAFKIIFSTK